MQKPKQKHLDFPANTNDALTNIYECSTNGLWLNKYIENDLTGKSVQKLMALISITSELGHITKFKIEEPDSPLKSISFIKKDDGIIYLQEEVSNKEGVLIAHLKIHPTETNLSNIINNVKTDKINTYLKSRLSDDFLNKLKKTVTGKVAITLN